MNQKIKGFVCGLGPVYRGLSRVRQQLLDYYRCLQRWRVRYAPLSPTEELHPCFLEAIKNLDIVEYYLDCSVLPDPQTENELRKYWEGLHERLEKEERRLA